MKSPEKPRRVVSSGALRVEEFGIDMIDVPRMMAMMSEQLYSDEPAAIVREYGCNGRDAHAMNGNEEKPCLATAPGVFNPEFVHRDYGPGLSEDDMVTVFIRMAKSTKTDSNVAVGFFGIGAKAAFAYTPSWSVISRHANLVTNYNIFIDTDEARKMAKVNERAMGRDLNTYLEGDVFPADELVDVYDLWVDSDTDEDNEERLDGFREWASENGTLGETGLEIRVPVQKEDFEAFKQAMEQTYKFFSVPPVNESGEPWAEPFKPEDAGLFLEDSGICLLGLDLAPSSDSNTAMGDHRRRQRQAAVKNSLGLSANWTAVMGGVKYDIPQDKLNAYLDREQDRLEKMPDQDAVAEDLAELALQKKFLNTMGGLVVVPIGALQPNPNRETLRLSDFTRDALLDRFVTARGELALRIAKIAQDVSVPAHLRRHRLRQAAATFGLELDNTVHGLRVYGHVRLSSQKYSFSGIRLSSTRSKANNIRFGAKVANRSNGIWLGNRHDSGESTLYRHLFVIGAPGIDNLPRRLAGALMDLHNYPRDTIEKHTAATLGRKTKVFFVNPGWAQADITALSLKKAKWDRDRALADLKKHAAEETAKAKEEGVPLPPQQVRSWEAQQRRIEEVFEAATADPWKAMDGEGTWGEVGAVGRYVRWKESLIVWDKAQAMGITVEEVNKQIASGKLRLFDKYSTEDVKKALFQDLKDNGLADAGHSVIVDLSKVEPIRYTADPPPVGKEKYGKTRFTFKNTLDQVVQGMRPGGTKSLHWDTYEGGPVPDGAVYVKIYRFYPVQSSRLYNDTKDSTWDKTRLRNMGGALRDDLKMLQDLGLKIPAIPLYGIKDQVKDAPEPNPKAIEYDDWFRGMILKAFGPGLGKAIARYATVAGYRDGIRIDSLLEADEISAAHRELLSLGMPREKRMMEVLRKYKTAVRRLDDVKEDFSNSLDSIVTKLEKLDKLESTRKRRAERNGGTYVEGEHAAKIRNLLRIYYRQHNAALKSCRELLPGYQEVSAHNFLRPAARLVTLKLRLKSRQAELRGLLAKQQELTSDGSKEASMALIGLERNIRRTTESRDYLKKEMGEKVKEIRERLEIVLALDFYRAHQKALTEGTNTKEVTDG